MPRIKRWFPVSHDLNRDPELWALCSEFGDRALRIWLEILSIADRNEGEVPGWSAEPSRDLGRALADASRTSRGTVANVSRRLLELFWVVPGNPAKIAKFWKYHRTQEQNQEHKTVPPDPTGPDLPNLPNPPISPHKKREATKPDGFAEFWKVYPRKVGKGAAEKAWKKLKPPLPTILAAIEKQKKQESWTKDAGQFIPHPATWLNQKRWEDEVIVSPLAAKRKGNKIDHGDSKSAIGWIAPGSFRIFESQKGKVDNPIPIGKIIESLDLKSKKE